MSREVIIDGNIMFENLKAAGLNEEWLFEELKKLGIGHVQDVFFGALDTAGGLYISKRMKNQEIEGQYGIE